MTPISWSCHEDEISAHSKCPLNGDFSLTAIILRRESTRRASNLSVQVLFLWPIFR